MKIRQFFCLVLLAVTCRSIYPGPLFDDFHIKQEPFLVDFGVENLKDVGPHIFYPFGGPDATYPLLMFPNLEILTIVGLESAKEIKEFPIELSNGSLRNLSSLYKSSFFRTLNMAQDAINITALILKQLENLGVKEVSVIAIKDRANAIEIKFTHLGKARTIRYYKAGLNNTQIDLEFIKSIGKFDAVLFKAASYLPHQKDFSIFRNLVLEHAKVIVQDSTGIPYKDLKELYDLKLYGQYLRPYEFPSAPKQLDYKKFSEEKDNSKLKFFFGYGGGHVPSNVLIAIRKNLPDL